MRVVLAFARNDLRGGPVRQTPIRTAPAVDRALRGDTDWQTGVRFTPKNNSRGMVVSNIVLPIGQTLGDLDRRDELPISGDTGFSVRQLIQPRPPEGTYLVVVDLEEMDPQVDAGSKSSAFSFTLVLEAAGVGAVCGVGVRAKRRYLGALKRKERCHFSSLPIVRPGDSFVGNGRRRSGRCCDQANALSDRAELRGVARIRACRRKGKTRHRVNRT